MFIGVAPKATLIVVAPLAVEVLSPSNSWAEMARKRRFYDQHGVDEYWVFDPQDGTLEVWVRSATRLTEAADPARGWVSPTTGVHVRVDGTELVLSLIHISEPTRPY